MQKQDNRQKLSFVSLRDMNWILAKESILLAVGRFCMENDRHVFLLQDRLSVLNNERNFSLERNIYNCFIKMYDAQSVLPLTLLRPFSSVEEVRFRGS